MPITVSEDFNSSEHRTGDVRESTLRYTVSGTNDSVAARQAVENFAPLTVDLQEPGLAALVRKSIRPTPIGENLWTVTVRFGDASAGHPAPSAGGPLVMFDTGGGTAHITHSIKTVGEPTMPPGFSGTKPDYKGAIGVTDNGPQGVDIQVPVFNFTETWQFDAALVTTNYVRNLFNLTGTVNDADYGDFFEGELLFRGASGSQRSDSKWEFVLSFSAIPNVTDITIGDIGTDANKDSPPIQKKGWEYLWVRYIDDTDAGFLIKKPSSVHIEQVYRTGNFNLLSP